jgi:hypothetical protein
MVGRFLLRGEKMGVMIYKVTRVGGNGIRFVGRDGTDFTDPNGLGNPQISRVLGNRLMGYVRCEVGGGMAEVLGEATGEEVNVFEGRVNYVEGGEEEEGPESFKFPR